MKLRLLKGRETMFTAQPLETSLEKFVDYAMSEPIVFFVGSGVSRDYPSVLPSAWEMLRYITLPVTAPPECPDHELDKIASALPELYYEALIEFTKREAVSLWEVLTFGQTKKELQPFNLGPNIGHMVLVYLAWRWRVPLITVNYDLMLELAARKMDLDPIVCHHKSPYEYVETKNQKEISIWKLHGSVDKVDSIRTTLYTITSLDASLMDKISQLFEKHRACLIGYSGRDIDLFPELVRFKFPSPAFWLGSNFGEQHRIYQRPDKFVMVKATSTDFAHLLVKNCIPENDPWKKVLTRAVEDKQKLSKEEIERRILKAKDKLIKLGIQHARQVMEKFLPQDSPDRLLIHGLALANISEDENSLKASCNYLNQFLEHPNLEPWKVCRALIIQAHSLHELSRFIDSEICSRKAFQIAISNGLREEQGHALASIDAALRGQHLPQLGYRDGCHLKRIGAWRTFAKMIIDSFRIWFHCPHHLSEQSTASQIRARWAYLGHLSRVAAIIQGGSIFVVSRLPGLGTLLTILARRIFLVWWRYFEEKSRQSGYAVGVAIAHRHIKRLYFGLSGDNYVPTMDFYSLMSASEQILFAYDQAVALLQKGENESAREKFRSCHARARRAGNKVLMLKAFIGLYHSGKAVNVDEVRQTLASIQGNAYREIETEVIHAFQRG
ncbi:SIR2 family protein [Dehalococcoidia bacterium]|nr:SIR2 family protein [Dehalococcoidia bacterium]